ncbi:AMP-dependent synthetase [Streptomyces inusitatus]|uniref:AMP-dependent synthetase n=1 Tax=Streptomyces inusitatus TaxID=68221 RepID=A0A918QBL0_9ACTN|nr:long-chain fatty acid--CoA ligase [Streptomyces inusitatus]GGZ39241.1 AMP-dependent synthetase [Streptomyces inusitatus]
MTRPLAAVLADTAARRPDEPAVIWGSASLTYRLLWELARACAAELRRHGIRPGDRVAMLLPNAPLFPIVYYGALALGATVVPMDTQLRSDEIEFILADSGARALVCAETTVGEGAKTAGDGVTLFTIGVEHPDAVRLDSREPAPPAPGYFPSSPDDIAAVLYTSGTTGRPKGAMLTHRNIVTNIEVTAVSPFDVHPDDVLLCGLPLSHAFGQTCLMSVAFHIGAAVVLMPRFTAVTALELMDLYGCTVFMGVPTMYHALLEAVANGAPAPRLRRTYSGGSALAVPVLNRVQEMFGCPVYEGYGLTETSPCVAYNQPGSVTRPGTVGTPITGVEVGIARADLEDRIELLPAGDTGEVVVRGHNVMTGYLGLPEETAAVLVDGWFRSGDLGVLETDGCLRLVDRKKDIIIRGGYNVYPREIEEVLMRHPAVEQTAVIGIPDDLLGEEIYAVVIARPEFTKTPGLAADIVAWSRDRLAGYKHPRHVEFAETLPTGPSGKVLKRLLASRFHEADGQTSDHGRGKRL